MNELNYDQTLPSFDELVELAENDPDAFVEFKKNACEQVITFASSEMQPRLRAQQSRLDRVIKHCKNPNHINLILSSELQQQVNKFQDVLNGDNPSDSPAEIIPFPNPPN
jgi:SPX domain protein involved in polyphosphate accumulation